MFLALEKRSVNMNINNQAIDMLKLLLSSQVSTEDDIMNKMEIDEAHLNSLFDILEDMGYMEVENGYFEKTCDNCAKGGNCSTEAYRPRHSVKKIRVLTWRAVEDFKEFLPESFE